MAAEGGERQREERGKLEGESLPARKCLVVVKQVRKQPGGTRPGHLKEAAVGGA